MTAILRMTLRLPSDLHAALADLARREGRSLHAQVIYLLRRALVETQR